MTNQVMPKWKIDMIEAAIQALQRDKVPITASRIRKRTGPSVSLDEIRHHVAAYRSRIAANDPVAPVRQRCGLRWRIAPSAAANNLLWFSLRSN